MLPGSGPRICSKCGVTGVTVVTVVTVVTGVTNISKTLYLLRFIGVTLI